MKKNQLPTSVFRLLPALALGLLLAWFLASPERLDAFADESWLQLYLMPLSITALLLPLAGAYVDQGNYHGIGTLITAFGLAAILFYAESSCALALPLALAALLSCFVFYQGGLQRHGLTISAYHPAAALGILLLTPVLIWVMEVRWRWVLPWKGLLLTFAVLALALYALRAKPWVGLARWPKLAQVRPHLRPIQRGVDGLLDLRNLLFFTLLFSAGVTQVQFSLWTMLATHANAISISVYTMVLLALMGLGALSTATIARTYGSSRLLKVAALFSAVLVLGLHFARGFDVAVYICCMAFITGMVAGNLLSLVPRFSPGEYSAQAMGYAVLISLLGVSLGKLFALGYQPSAIPVGNTLLFLAALATAVTIHPHRALRALRRLESKSIENPRDVEWSWVEEPKAELARHTLISRFSHVLARTIADIFFGRVRVVGRENLIANQGAIFVANHPNTFFDPLLVTALAPGRLHYWAKSTFWRVPLLGSILDQLGAIPVFRRQDAEPGGASGNSKSLALAAERLNRGAHMLIFPEGVSAEGLSLKPIKTGAARLGFAALDGRNWEGEVPMIPIGIDYSEPTLFRGGVTVRIGKPVLLSSFREHYLENAQATITEVTRALSKRMAKLLPHLDQPSLEKLVHAIHDLYGERVLQILDKQDETSARRAIVRAVNHYQVLDPDTVVLFNQRMEAYERERERLAQDHFKPIPMAELLQLLTSLFSIASFGVVTNWLPYKLSGRVVAMFSVDSVWVASLKLVIGAGVFSLYYALLGLVLSLTVGPAMAAVLLFAVIFTAFLALGALDQSTFRQERLKAMWHAFWTRDTNMELEEMRVSLIQDLERFRESYAFYMAKELNHE